jgi:hypothetical protein
MVKHKFQIIEINIPGAGHEVLLSKVTEADHDEITGVAIYKDGGSHGHGTFGLRIAGDEIFPDAFHACIVTLDSENKNIVLGDVLWPVKKPGKGSQIQVQYREPADGAAGKLWLYLIAKKCS